MTLLFVQPVLYDYRAELVNGLSSFLEVVSLSNLRTNQPSCKHINVTNPLSLKWLFIFLKLYFRKKKRLIVFLPAYTTHFGIVSIAVTAFFLRVNLYVHGQALFKKTSISASDKLISWFWISIAKKYISYSELGLKGPFYLNQKIVVMSNRFESLSSLSLQSLTLIPAPKFDKFTPLRMIFIGRDRPGVNFSLLLEAISSLSSQGIYIHLDVIGFSSSSLDKHIVYHGPLYKQEIARISQDASIGIYPGDAGLSILHYMALGLCPVVHSDMALHSGPEPNYIKDSVNGRLFKRGSLQSVVEVLMELYTSPVELFQLRTSARNFAEELHRTPLSSELMGIISL
jgi:glycosyltransferase involved in cell wall biosynthesis